MVLLEGRAKQSKGKERKGPTILFRVAIGRARTAARFTINLSMEKKYYKSRNIKNQQLSARSLECKVLYGGNDKRIILV